MKKLLLLIITSSFLFACTKEKELRKDWKPGIDNRYHKKINNLGTIN